MKYWFLYNLSDGTIYGAPYLGFADEWTNIPDGCGMLGSFDEATATDEVKQAYSDPMSYTIVNGGFVYKQYIPPIQPVLPPTEIDRIKALEQAMMMLI